MPSNHLQDPDKHHHLTNESPYCNQQHHPTRTERKLEQHFWDHRSAPHQQNDSGRR